MAELRPLAGIRVLDLSRLLPGPFATMVLADLGAQVDKLEPPGQGDYLRAMPPLVDGTNAAFRTLNRGKRSFVLDLKTERGRAALEKLVPHYDVLVESFRPGVMTRLGLGYERLAELHPGLVYCAITGYGQDGPLSQRAGHDLNYVALAGLLGVTGPAGGVPQIPGSQVGDIGGSLFAVVGILSALQGRQHGGKGCLVDIALCESAMPFVLWGLTSRWAGLALPRGSGVLSGGIAPYDIYETKDGRAVTLAALEPKFWNRFCEAVGLDPGVQDLVPGPHQEDLRRTVAAKMAARTWAEWHAVAEAADCCIAPVPTPAELADDAQLSHRRAVVGEGAHAQLRTPFGAAVPPPEPTLGQHTHEVLTAAGLSTEEIASLGA